MDKKIINLSCLKDMADENEKFYKVLQDTALAISKEVEIHMNNLEAAIARNYGKDKELPEKLESIYLLELTLYKKVIDFLESSRDIMQLSNGEILNEIYSTMNLSKEAMLHISLTVDSLSTKYKELKENHKE